MRIGVDLGGTKIEIAALDGSGAFALRERHPSPTGDYEKTVHTIRDLVTAAETKLDRRCSVGVGIPGAISPASGVVKNANSTWLNGKPLDRDLSAALSRPVRVANDANCFALSEAADGAGQGKHVVFGVILGTGVGGGIVVGGRVLTGPNAIAGEWGHNPLPWPDAVEQRDQACYCGKSGCIETWLSGPALSRQFAAATGRKADAAAIARLAAEGDAHASALLEAFERRLAKALAHVVDILDPDVVVLGGGLSNLDRLYTNVQPQIAHHAFSDTIATPIVKNKWGDSGGVRGAAWLWPETDA
ncbi:MAG: ROK family protein [Alphaproteobacteria bacterium]|nr:ROK family protein [Alphaproteobacteria bacterium]